ncbi:MAG: NAD-binding protein [Candidatus Saganbacteria bacterium]|nr:NAD-binding protein [Candidatus Saganbacteria bacterium]
MNPLRRLFLPLGLLFLLMVFGVLGYVFIEKAPFLDALYMVVITLSTVGFREVVPLNSLGKILTMILILCGVGTMIYTLGQLGEMIMEGQLIGFRRRKRMEKQISDLKDHYIICGFGRVGHQAAEAFKRDGIPYVVIDSKEDTEQELEPRGIPYIVGEINSDENLEKAGIKRAKGLIACADSDASNVFVTITARVLNPNILVIARASSLESRNILKKAGANQVVSPYVISGRRMAALAVRPVSVEFLDTFIHGGDIDLEIEEFNVDGNSKLTGKSLKDLDIRGKTGATILAVKRKSGKFDLQPSGATTVEEGDILVGLGTEEQLKLLEGMR